MGNLIWLMKKKFQFEVIAEINSIAAMAPGNMALLRHTQHLPTGFQLAKQDSAGWHTQPM